MTKSEYRTAIEHVIYLISCAVNRRVPDPSLAEGMNLEHVYEAAQFHLLAAATGMALEAAGIRDSRFQKAIASSQRRTLLFDRDRKAVTEKLEQEGIWYMPLKGVILKDMYPQFGMREMADNDFLIDADRAEDVYRVMTGLGFRADSYGKTAHDTYFREPVSNFEMHRILFRYVPNTRLSSYYADVKSRLIKDEDNDFGYHFSDEDFYLFLAAHEYKHFAGKGTGLRSLLDIYVFLRGCSLDYSYIARESEKMGIAGFEENNRALASRLFDGELPKEEQKIILDQIISDGTYGDRSRQINRQISQKGRLGYLLSRLTLPRESMEYVFPVLKKAPALYPFFWVYRLVRNSILGRKKALLELKAIVSRKPLPGIGPAQEGQEEKPG